MSSFKPGDRVTVTFTGTIEHVRASDGVFAVRGDDHSYFYCDPTASDTKVRAVPGAGDSTTEKG
jgi:hypothetical protein